MAQKGVGTSTLTGVSSVVEIPLKEFNVLTINSIADRYKTFRQESKSP